MATGLLSICSISVCNVCDVLFLACVYFICYCYSNSVGMSAVFPAVANGIDSFKAKKAVDIYSIVKGLRRYRAGAIERFDQYKFVYQVNVICLPPYAILSN